ncbi:chitin deacetylase 8-like [Diorhabda sublineata]|uniref:chitin deacetylase 8-like n=1 Tax=Diorhabda sublineata TaxID=1163346 RepID=UPI0024E16C07|nr:chitin deacetylase 8-like [Diorhabda sublineata]
MRHQKRSVCVFVLLLAQLVISDKADDCKTDVCNLPECRCSSATSPFGSDIDNYPQLIGLAFDEAVTDELYTNRWVPLLLDADRVNPDGAGISATFFVPHEYTDYRRVNDLYNFGMEIAVHSITKNSEQSYWRTASEDVLVAEFQGQKQIISKYANIPSEAIVGARTPQLQLAGDNSIKAYVTAELSYDSSWPSLPSSRFFPYTLDYASTQACLLGAECPTGSFPGFWILPINDLQSSDGTGCNNLASCDISGSADDIANWLTDQIEQVRTTTKTPMTLSIDSYWFNFTTNSFEGLTKFMNNMKDKSDVFFVSQKQILDFIKNPVPVSEFNSDNTPSDPANCHEQKCQLKKGNEDRNMISCVQCPAVYPWLNDPDGNGS